MRGEPSSIFCHLLRIVYSSSVGDQFLMNAIDVLYVDATNIVRISNHECKVGEPIDASRNASGAQVQEFQRFGQEDLTCIATNDTQAMSDVLHRLFAGKPI